MNSELPKLFSNGMHSIFLLMMTWLICAILLPSLAMARPIFDRQKFAEHDAILVTDADHTPIYQWQADKPLIPASLIKLVTAYLALDKWGPEHRFETEFYVADRQLWVRGLGDPYLVSEELDLIADQLRTLLPANLKSLHIDSSYMLRETVPGRSRVADPYNAPLSAVAANFNTVLLRRRSGVLQSAELQTPLTDIAQAVGTRARSEIGHNGTRINLIDVDNAQHHFAQLLVAKLNLGQRNQSKFKLNQLLINQNLPPHARLILRYKNSTTLAEVLRAALEYSNNFIANQLFLLLAEDAETKQLNFANAKNYAHQKLRSIFRSNSATIVEGAGLSRQNKMSATDISRILSELRPHQSLLRQYPLKATHGMGVAALSAFAKTGTLADASTFAGYLNIAQQQYQFVFMFNRKTPQGYRENLLQLLAEQLVADQLAGSRLTRLAPRDEVGWVRHNEAKKVANTLSINSHAR